MKVSEIKKEIVDSKDLKVKLEENSSSVVYDVEVTSKVDIKPTVENSPQSLPTCVTKEEIQSAIYITVKPDRNPSSDELELEPESKNSSNGESEIDSESDSKKKHPQGIPQTQASSIKIKKNNPKRAKTSPKKTKNKLQCSLCPESFNKIGLLIKHAQKEHAKVRNRSLDRINIDEDETASQCPLCFKSLASVGKLRRHFLRVHNKNKPFQCTVCLDSRNEIKKFATEYILREHVKQVHDPARYKFQCDICTYKCPSLFSYKRHKLTHTGIQYKCEYCSKTYRKKDSMLKHIIAVHKEYTDRHETFKCNECEQLFCSKKDLECHVLQTHAEGTVQCKICLKKFPEEGTLNQHLNFAHREHRTTLVCDVCFKVFKNNQDLVQHLEKEHKRLFKCRKCFRSFVSKEDYDSHTTNIFDEEGRNAEKLQLQCSVCLVFLSTECSFTTHQDTHLSPSEIERKSIAYLDPYDPQDCLMKCDFCPKTFVQKSLLLDHATKCHPNQKLKCKSCEKSFQVKFQLNKHELVHSTKKLFECQVCHKGFSNLHCLKRHEGIHKMDKKYKCSKCKKSFADSSCLRLHMANHHEGPKPFKCDICKKAFVFKKLLVKHLVVHTDEGPFSCSKCSFSSKRAGHLRMHQQSRHSVNPLNNYRKRPVGVGPHLKHLENVFYVCTAEECDFNTKDEKKVAIHYVKHKLPKVVLPTLIHGPSSAVFSSKSTPTNQRLIQARYKCTKCFKTFSWPSGLTKHIRIFHKEKKEEKEQTNLRGVR